MDIREYEVRMSKRLWSYEFHSEGPKGRIKKFIQFTPVRIDGKARFNLFFGDWNEETESADDLTITNNKDSLQVLKTVAKTVLEFTNLFPNAYIHIKGSTPSRTRLYRIGITNNLSEISKLFTVSGYTNNKQWQPFLKNIDYDAFMVHRK